MKGYRMEQKKLRVWINRLLVLLVFIIPLSVTLGGVVFSGTVVLALYDHYRYGRDELGAAMPRKLKIALWSLLLLSGVSVGLSGNIGASAYNWCWVIGQEAGSFYLFWYYVRQEKQLILVIKTLLVTGGIIAIMALCQYFLGWGYNTDNLWTDPAVFPELQRRAYATLGNPNILGTYLVMIAAYCLGLFAPLPGGKRRIALMVIFALCLVSILFTFSRGNWLALCGVAVTFALFFYHKAIVPFVAGGMAVLYFSWHYIAARLMSIFTVADTSATLRFAYMRATWLMMLNNPLGVGWYGYQFAFPDYDYYLQRPDMIMYHCHNLFLNIGSELGFLGLGLYLGVMYGFIKLALTIKQHTLSPQLKGLACGYLAMLVGIAISGLTDYTLFNIQLGILFWMSNAIILVGYRLVTNKS